MSFNLVPLRDVTCRMPGLPETCIGSLYIDRPCSTASSNARGRHSTQMPVAPWSGPSPDLGIMPAVRCAQWL